MDGEVHCWSFGRDGRMEELYRWGGDREAEHRAQDTGHRARDTEAEIGDGQPPDTNLIAAGRSRECEGITGGRLLGFSVAAWQGKARRG